jgi:hypothetical protein
LEKVRSQRTRSHGIEVPTRENNAEIMHTLLGIELKVGRRRFACPDLASARYMQVFARIGCGRFAMPYDITRISGIADEMEVSWHKTLLQIRSAEPEGTKGYGRLRSLVVREMREEILTIGAGELMPGFARSTKQKSN